MNVLLLARFFLSGQTTHVLSLAEILRRQGHGVAVATAGRLHPGAWQNALRRLGAAGIDCLRLARAAELEALVLSVRPDVIHCHSSDLIAPALRLGRAFRVPVVYTAHGMAALEHVPALLRVDKVIAVGPTLKRALEAKGVSGVALIGNGVDLERFRPRPKASPFQVAYVGRVDSSKRPGLEALVAAARDVPQVRLVVASNDRPAAPHCRALGWLDDVSELLGESRVVCGTGLALREGLASGCAAMVLGVKYGGLLTPERAAASPPGFVPMSGLEGEEPRRERLAIDLIRLAQDSARTESLADWGRRYALAHFDLAEVGRRTARVYESVFAR